MYFEHLNNGEKFIINEQRVVKVKLIPLDDFYEVILK